MTAEFELRYSPDRQERFNRVITQIREKYPDMRFGQLICNLSSLAEEYPDPWDVEDDDLLRTAERFLESNRDRIYERHNAVTATTGAA